MELPQVLQLKTVGNDQSGTKYINPTGSGNSDANVTSNNSTRTDPNKSEPPQQNNITKTDPPEKSPDPVEPKKPEGNKPYATPVPGKSWACV